MYDARKIIAGLIIFFVLLTAPIWYSLATGEAASTPELVIAAGQDQCVEPAPYMRDKHIDLLDEWRQSVVREGNRTYVAGDGKQYEMSLTGTCIGCHDNKADFCDQCHDYAGVEPGCWDCHNVPE